MGQGEGHLFPQPRAVGWGSLFNLATAPGIGRLFPVHQMNTTERWLSGRKRPFAKWVDAKSVSWVRIPSSPPL